MPEPDSFKLQLAQRAKALRVPMTHTPRDEEFMPVLSYRVDQEIAAARKRLEALKQLRDSFTA